MLIRNVGYILIIGLALLVLGEIKQEREKGIAKEKKEKQESKSLKEFLLTDRYYSPVKTNIALVIILICILNITGLLTWGMFKVFPTTIEPQKVVTVFAGIFGVITGSIGLYKLFK